MHKFQALFSPLKIGSITLKNRIVRAPMYLGLASDNGEVTPRMLTRYARLARGGVSLVIVEAASVNEYGISSPVQLRIDRDEFIPGLRRLAESIKRHGAVPGIQLFHGGRYALMGRELLSASGEPLELIPGNIIKSRAMEMSEIDSTVDDFVRAAERAIESGFELIEIHGAGGYIISDFLSPRTNHRKDKYGGSIENRMRFLLSIVKSIINRINRGSVLGIRLMVDELVPGGFNFDEARVLAKMLVESGVDYLNPLIGTHEAYVNDETSERLKRQGFAVHYSRGLKGEIKSVPVFCNWRINTPEMAEEIIKNGYADAVSLARPLLIDPDFPVKAMQGRENEIIQCTSCYTCYYLALRGAEVRCKEWEKQGHGGKRTQAH